MMRNTYWNPPTWLAKILLVILVGAVLLAMMWTSEAQMPPPEDNGSKAWQGQDGKWYVTNDVWEIRAQDVTGDGINDLVKGRNVYEITRDIDGADILLPRPNLSGVYGHYSEPLLAADPGTDGVREVLLEANRWHHEPIGIFHGFGWSAAEGSDSKLGANITPPGEIAARLMELGPQGNISESDHMREMCPGGWDGNTCIDDGGGEWDISPAPLPDGFNSPTISYNPAVAGNVTIVITHDNFPTWSWQTTLYWVALDCGSEFDPATHWQLCGETGTAWVHPVGQDGMTPISGWFRVQWCDSNGCSEQFWKQFY